MTKVDKQLERLQQITSALADQALRPVTQAQARIQRIETQIASLADHRAKLTKSCDDPAIAGTMLMQAERLRKTQAAAMSELATAHVALESARLAAARAVGRDKAIEAVTSKRNTATKLEGRRKLLR